LSRIKTINGQRIHGIRLAGKEKVYDGKDNKKQEQQQ